MLSEMQREFANRPEIVRPDDCPDRNWSIFLAHVVDRRTFVAIAAEHGVTAPRVRQICDRIARSIRRPPTCSCRVSHGRGRVMVVREETVRRTRQVRVWNGWGGVPATSHRRTGTHVVSPAKVTITCPHCGRLLTDDEAERITGHPAVVLRDLVIGKA